MALESSDQLSKILVQPGRLVLSPSNLATAFPYGGTSLGPTEDGILLNREINWEKMTVEEYGTEPVKWIYTGEEVSFQVDFTQFQTEVLQMAWPQRVGTGGTSGRPIIEWPGDGDIYPGYDLINDAVTLLFVPEDRSTGYVVFFRKAVPTSASQWKFDTTSKIITRVEFQAGRDDSISSGDAKYNSRGFIVCDITDLTL